VAEGGLDGGVTRGVFWWHWGHSPKCLGSGKWHVEGESISLVILLCTESGAVRSDRGRTKTQHGSVLGFSRMDHCTDSAFVSSISGVRGAYGCQWTLGSHGRQGPHSDAEVG